MRTGYITIKAGFKKAGFASSDSALKAKMITVRRFEAEKDEYAVRELFKEYLYNLNMRLDKEVGVSLDIDSVIDMT
jgi:hypothetical protein